jgi:hypothetical protein
MKCFELIKKVLDEVWLEIPGDTDAEKAALVKPKLVKLSASYSALSAGHVIDYSDPVTKFAYIFAYTSAHGDFLYQLLQKTQRRHTFPIDGNFSLTSLGGGPGSDLIGCLKFFEWYEASGLTFSFNSFDKDGDWSYCWTNVAGCISRENSAEEVCKALFTNFHLLDITQEAASTKIKKFMNADMFSMIYFMSEVLKHEEICTDFFDDFFENIKSGSIVTFIDNAMPDVYEWFDELTHDNFDVLMTGEEQWIASPSEEKNELIKYIELFGRTPKVQSKLAYRVVRKE